MDRCQPVGFRNRMRPRGGMVLLLALLCLLALEVTAVGVHFVVMQELRVARAVRRSTQLRLAAQAAVSRALAAWPEPGLSELPMFVPLPVLAANGTAPGDIRFSATIERLGDDILLVRGAAESQLRERAGIGALVALARPEQLAALVPAAVVTTGTLELLDGGRVEGGSLSDLGGESSSASADSIGPITRAHMISSARTVPAAVITPFPVADASGCVADRFDNWGEPADGVTACRSHLPILFRRGDLDVAGGRGQGILIVDGRVTLDGLRFDGIVIVRGNLELRAGAAIRGAVLVQGSVRAQHSTISLDRRAVADALRDIRVRGPFRSAARTWIPLF